ncbi:hypothetical protein [Azospirillum argentinense]
MGTLEFISNSLGHLAWPITVIVIAIMAREPIYSLIPKIKNIKWKDFEASFIERLERAEESISAEPSANIADLLHNPGFGEYVRIAKVSPEAAVLMSWRELEQTLRPELRRTADSRPVVTDAKRLLVRANKSTLKQFNDLRKLRNMVAHAGDVDITEAMAIEYVRLVFLLKDTLEREIKNSADKAALALGQQGISG